MRLQLLLVTESPHVFEKSGVRHFVVALLDGRSDAVVAVLARLTEAASVDLDLFDVACTLMLPFQVAVSEEWGTSEGIDRNPT